MKKSFLLTLVLALLLTWVPMPVSAEVIASGSCGENAQWRFDDETGTLTISGTGAMADYYFSGEDADMHPWLYLKEKILSIVIEPGITYLGNYTFNGCTAVKSISIPNTVTALGDSVFMGCTSLTSAVLPDSVTSLYGSTFRECTSLADVTLSKNLQELSSRTFQDCTALESLTIPGIPIVGPAFEGCSNLKEIILEEGVEVLGEFAFQGCYALSEITIPKTVKEVLRSAFYDCAALMNIIFTGDAPYISDDAFSYVVATAYYPGNNSTWTADMLQNYGGTLMWKSVDAPDDVVPEENSGVCGENVTWKLENGTLTISGTGPMEFVPWDGKRAEIEKVVVEKGVTSLYHEAFYECPNLTSVSLPDGLTEIGVICFVGCPKLTTINFPDSITTIGERAFEECDGLTNVVLPTSLKILENRVFFLCDSIKSVTLPEGLTKIGESALNSCISLTSLVIPSTVESIGDCAFANCSSLKKIEFRGPAPVFETTWAFHEVRGATVRYPIDLAGWDDGSAKNHVNCQLTWDPYCSGTHYDSDGTITQESTCSTPGTMEGLCEICDVYFTKKLPLTDHSYDDGIVTTEPTCEDVGILTRTCLYCDAYITEEVSSLGHDLTAEEIVVKEATCTEEGQIQHTCSRCEEGYTETVPALDHDFSGTAVFNEADHTHTVSCSRCTEEMTEACEFYDGEITAEATTGTPGVLTYYCMYCLGSYEEYFPLRLAGSNRYETAFLAADQLKIELGVEEFENIIVASGTGFADALAGSYLAVVKNAPILLVNSYTVADVADYIGENLASGGTVYLLGGNAAVPASMEAELEGLYVERLAGANRYETNLMILEEAGFAGEEILVCTGNGFADSLSASAVGKPILLVNKSLNAAQLEFLEVTSGEFVIIGGESAVSAAVENKLDEYGEVSRLAGANRYETSVLVAERFFDAPTSAVVAYSQNFPDGLCGGPLAAATDSPLLLMATNRGDNVIEYAQEVGISSGAVLGGTGLIDDATAKNLFSMN